MKRGRGRPSCLTLVGKQVSPFHPFYFSGVLRHWLLLLAHSTPKVEAIRLGCEHELDLHRTALNRRVPQPVVQIRHSQRTADLSSP